MNGRLAARKPSDEATLDLTPLIGMVLVLLTFFAIRLNFTAEARVHSTRGQISAADDQASAAGDRSGAQIQVGVTGAGTIHLGGRRIELSALGAAASRLILESPGARVLVLADETARAAVIARVIDQLKLAGAADIGLSTRPEGIAHGDG